MPRNVWLWGPVLAHLALIFTLSGQSTLPEVSARVSDKHWHAGAYAVLAGLVGRALAGGSPAGLTAGRVVGAAALAAAYGATDEWHQWFVPGRSPEVGDWLADLAGAAIAAAGMYTCGIIARSRRVRESPETS